MTEAGTSVPITTFLPNPTPSLISLTKNSTPTASTKDNLHVKHKPPDRKYGWKPHGSNHGNFRSPTRKIDTWCGGFISGNRERSNLPSWHRMVDRRDKGKHKASLAEHGRKAFSGGPDGYIDANDAKPKDSM
ncbi:unnamed protein product [Camellia sinensis]